MKDWQYAIIAGVLAVIIGLQLSLGIMVTGYEAMPGQQVNATDEPRNRAVADAQAPEVRYGNLSNESREEVDALIEGERIKNGTPKVVQKAGNETPVVVTGTQNVTANATADAYTITSMPMPRYDGVFRLGLIGVVGGTVAVYWGYKRREINSLQREIDEFME